jgi:hypothetical protein
MSDIYKACGDPERIVLDEPILPDDYPVHQGYFYVVNGKPKTFIDGQNVTVGRWKAMRIPGVDPVTEVRRCDIVGRQRVYERNLANRGPAEPTNVITEAKPHSRRRPRKTYKIRKFM